MDARAGRAASSPAAVEPTLQRTSARRAQPGRGCRRIWSDMSGSGTGVPDVNDLIRVTLANPGAPDTAPEVDVRSRIEDLTRNRKTGKVVSYLIAVPRFSGDVV